MTAIVDAKPFVAERRVFSDIKKRCNNPNCRDFPNYGGRGIRCLFTSFDEFLADVGARPGQGYSINRIDNARHYEPGNLRWDDKIAQNRNRRNNHVLTYNGESLCIAEWAERMDMPHRRLQARIAMGWDVERALLTPPPSFWQQQKTPTRRQGLDGPINQTNR
jgi:hypothetical protein